MTWNQPRRGVLGVGTGLLVGLSAAVSLPAGAINVSWDDAGGSANKDWSNFGNWNPDGSVAGDDVFIGNLAAAANDVTLVDQAFSIASLTVTNGADVVNSTDGGATNDFELLVNGATNVSGAGSLISIFGGDPDGLDTDTLTISGGGTVQLNSQTAQGTAVVEVDSGLLANNAGGTILGNGIVEVIQSVASPTTLISNSGTITASHLGFVFGGPPARTLSINATDPDARFDWDGTGNGTLQVNGNATLDINVQPGSGGVTDAFSGTMNLNTGGTIDIEDAWSLDSGTINVNTGAFIVIIGQDPNPGPGAHIAGANWTMTGGAIEIADSWDTLILDSQVTASGGTINNSGTMEFNGGATLLSGVDFNMIGGDASLIINSTVNIDTPDFNLDGTGSVGNVTTINAGGNLDLDLGAGADEDFNHTINMNGGELDVTTADNDWSLVSNGNINAAGGVTSTINGETFNIAGDIDVSGSSTLNINAVSSYTGTADVTIGAGSTLNHGTATYNGGSYTGAGVLKKGNATIAGNTTWNVDTVDIDDGSTTINNNTTLTINTDAIDSSGDGIDNTITVADTGLLQINLSGGGDVVFDAAGRLVYNGNTVSSNFILAPTTGSALRFQTGSQLNINGDGGSLAKIKLNGGTLNINDAAEDFRFEGGTLIAGNTNEITGGTINGPGEIQAGTGHALRGHGTINAQIDFDGTAQLIAENGLLDVNGVLQDVGTIGTFGGAAVLDMQLAWNTNVANDVRLAGGRIQGATITNAGGGGINGNGTVIARVINNTVIDAESGGTLIIDNIANDWDGAANTGQLRALAGNLEVRDNSAFLFNGTVQVNSGREVFANGFELEFDPASNLILNNGAYRSTHATDIGGTVTVGGGNSTLQNGGTTIFEASSSTTLNGNLRLNNAGVTRVLSGATFAGGGSLVNLNGRTLDLWDGANVGVLIDNQGIVQIQGTGNDGQVNGDDFQQSANGELNLDLTGTGLNAYDRLTLTGAAQLNGTLDIDLLGGFNPGIGDAFSLLSAVGGVFGTFSTLDLPALDPGEVWTLDYNATSVVLSVAAGIAGDYNNSGQVEQGDLDLVLLNWGSNTPPVPAGWVNDLPVGIIDQAELDGVLLNWGNTAEPAGSAVPEPATAALLSLGALAMLRRRSA